MSRLWKVRAAVPFLLAVFLNAFVDLGHKILVQNTILKIYDQGEQVILTAIVNGLILLPFILLFSPAGFAVDKYPKHSVMRLSAWFAVALTVAITLCYALGWFWVAFAMTFLMAVQSAFYSPAKYGYIKGLFGKEHLAQANGLVQAVSIIAILAGTVVFSGLFEYWYQPEITDKSVVMQLLVPAGFLLIINSVIELIAVYRLPQQDSVDQTKDFSMKSYLTGQSAINNIKPLLKRHVIRQAMIGLAIFWSAGQVMLSVFPAFAESITGENNALVLNLVLAASGIGIAIGSTLASRFSKNYIETGLIPTGAVGFALGLWLLPHLDSMTAMGLDFLFIGIMGGLFIVPLNALIQFHAAEHEMGSILATNNFVQNTSMLLFLVLTVVCASVDISAKNLLIMLSIVAIVGSVFTIYKLPQSLVRFLFSYIFSHRYRIDVQGMKNIPATGGVLLLGNHISWIDWAIIQIASPRPVRFVMLKSIYQRWYLQWFFKLFGCVPIEAGAGSKKSLESVAELLNAGDVVCLFPEGAISRNGHLAEFRRGFEKSAAMANDDVVILPFYLRGLWGSQFSRSSENIKRQRGGGLRRDIIVAFGPALAKETPAEIVKRRVFDLSIHSWQVHANMLPTIADAWIDAVKRDGNKMAIADTLAAPLSGYSALVGAIAMSRRIKRMSPEATIGLLVPTSAGGVLANMATLLAGKTLVNLNYTASSEAFSSALNQANIKTVYTSERFLKKLAQRGVDLLPLMADIKVVFLETIKDDISLFEKISLSVQVRCLPGFLLKACYSKIHDNNTTATILFSSGSEGLPKGVCLSHKNIMANLKQISDVLNTQERDVIMASLPLFHAFGLTVTQFMPLVEAIPMVCHADPTDAVGLAKAVAKYQATIMCGTSTFLRLYSRNSKVHPLMLDSLRIIVSGAERLNPSVRQAFKEKFKKDIFEGYGATETTPVASVNIPDQLSTSDWKVQLGSKQGSVGMPLPGTSFKIVDPETQLELPVGEDGMILIGGAQVMQGYLNQPEKTASVLADIDDIRWYVTGDKGHLDSDGFLTIVDRYSRFAKIGGEMISLSAVEAKVQEALALGESEVIAVNIPDDKKGEQVILLTDHEIELKALKEAMLAVQCNPLMIPSRIRYLDVLPKLGSGKVDFVAAKRVAQE